MSVLVCDCLHIYSLDDVRALEFLASHLLFNPKRIVLMGFSRAGQAACYASLKRFNRLWNKSGVEFAAYVPLYPDCMTTYVTDTEIADCPIRIFGGTLDDYDPISVCKAYVQRLRTAGHDVEVTEYPNASHAFDNPLLPQSAIVSAKAETVRNCKIPEGPEGLLINVETGQPVTHKAACGAHTSHVGYDPAADQAVKTSVKEFLKSVFN